MRTKSSNRNYYLSSISNLLAAIGGGTILGKGVNVINNPFFQGGSILAFFVGTVFGLIFLQTIPKKISDLIARFFSILAGLISLILLFIFVNYSNNNQLMNNSAIVFFILLCIRFGFWFYSRVLRASSVAGYQQNIAWVELGYYSGMIGGLVFWNILNLNVIMSTALIIDAFLQFSAGIIDLYVKYQASKITQKNTNNISTDYSTIKKIIHPAWYWNVALAVILITVGAQVIIFSLAHKVSTFFSPYILAVFYFGVSLAAYVYKLLQIEMSYKEKNFKTYPIFLLHYKNNKVELSISLVTMFLTLSILLVIIGIVNLHWGIEIFSFPLGLKGISILIFVAVAAFIYELFALALLDRIGLEERISNQSGYVMRTYGYMGMGAALSLWIINLSNYSFLGLTGLLIFCSLITLFCIKRNAHNGHLVS